MINIEWRKDTLVLLDQTKLPTEITYVHCTDWRQVAEAIKRGFKKALPDTDVVFQVDIGHTYPHMYVVNGAMARVEICDGHGLVQYRMDA